MRAAGWIAVLAAAACAGPGGRPDRSIPRAYDGAFAGGWVACDDDSVPDTCSRYLLVQRGGRICGTWSYVASSKSYDGHLIAEAVSTTEARRTHVCGRPGSETRTACDAGWQRIDEPLRLCDGKLSDVSRADGSCLPEYAAEPVPRTERDALLAQPWLQACLAGDP